MEMETGTGFPSHLTTLAWSSEAKNSRAARLVFRPTYLDPLLGG